MKNLLIISTWLLFVTVFVASLILRRRFTVLLMVRHSRTYADLGAPPPQLLPFDSNDNLKALRAQSLYVRSGRYRELGDPELERLGTLMRRLTLAQIVLGASFGVLVAREVL